MKNKLDEVKLGIIGLGYVGLPLAVAFGRQYPTIGFDISRARVEELKGGTDHTLEASDKELREASCLSYTAVLEDLCSCNTYIVTVPTPVDRYNRPDLSPLI